MRDLRHGNPVHGQGDDGALLLGEVRNPAEYLFPLGKIVGHVVVGHVGQIAQGTQAVERGQEFAGLAFPQRPRLPLSNDQHAGVLAGLQGEVDTGRLVIPLSSVTYTELTENPRDQHREPAASVMLPLSGLVTIAPPHKIVDEELARELNRRFGRPAFPVKVPKIGYGAGFAFGTPGRVKTTGFTAAERDRIETQMGKTIADLELQASALFEYWLLATPRSLRDRIPGFEPVPTRQDAAAELAEIQVMVDSLHSGKEIATRPMDGVAARQLCRDIFGNFTRALASAGFVTSLPLRTRAEQR